ncbi:MAG: ribonuclease P protein component [Anaerolineales bacterium]|jgi:ribonuclease P protein component
MDRRYRLTNSYDFKRVRHTGQSFAHPLVILIVSKNQLNHARFGFTAGKALGNAVRRNKAKRRLRETFRILLPRIAPGWDIIAIARPALLNASWQDLQHVIMDQLDRAGLFNAK